MARRVLQFMDDMHLSSQDIFMQYYNAMEANNISKANSILNQNSDIKNQITNAENVNVLISEVNSRELKPKVDIDYYLDGLLSVFENMIDSTKIMGEWNASVQYTVHNFVYYNNKGYFAYSNIEPPIGTLPTDTNYWLEYDLKGLQGYGGFTNLNYLGAWNNSIDYNPFDVVVYQNKLWMANAKNTNYAPNLNHYPWNLIMLPETANRIAVQKNAPIGYNIGDFWFKITQGDDIIQTSWETKNPESEPRFSSGSFIIGNNIYVVGGQNAVLIVMNTNEAYDMVTGTWSKKADMPVGKDGFAAFSINNMGYCIGGLDANNIPTNDCYSYNATSNSWNKISDFPIIMAYLGSVAVKDQNAYIGGFLTPLGVNGDVYKFNTSNNSWTKETTMPVPRFSSSVSVVGNKLYFLGGGEVTEIPHPENQIYDLTTKSWSTGADMPNARMAMGTFVNNKDIYTVGGLDEIQYSTSLNQVYNVESNSWRNETPMTYKRNSLTSQYTNTKGYAIGGLDISTVNISGYMEEYSFQQNVSSFEMVIDTSVVNSISTENNENLVTEDGNNIITEAVGKTVSIPMVQSGSYNYWVDWGDGTSSIQITSYDSPNATHTYTADGEYTIKLIGTLSALQFTGSIATSLKEITKCEIGFDSIEAMFKNCVNLTSVVDGIFDKSLNVVSAESTFEGCSSLQIIPMNLFSNNSNITNFQNTFASCGLTSIPIGLFDGNNMVTSFKSTFRDCANLVSIPKGLFDNNKLVTDFQSTFIRCSKLSQIPNNLLVNNPAVQTYEYMFTSTSLTNGIPGDLFGTACASATNFSSIFSTSNLKSIPAGIFRYAYNASSFNNAFSGNTITSIPDNCFNGNNASWTNGFPINSITSLGVNSLNGLNITSDMFKNKTNLKTVSDNAFWSNVSTSITNAPTNIFNGCSGLTSIGNINLKVVDTNTDLTNMFSGCTSLSDISGFYYKENQPSIACNISFADCPLTHDSLININNSLVVNTQNTKKTLTLGSSNLSKLTDIEKLDIINKFWDLNGYVININAELAQNIVKYLYGGENTGTEMYQETSLYFYVRLYSIDTTQDIGYYAVEKSTGYVYEYNNVPDYEYYIQTTDDISKEVPVSTEYWIPKQGKDENGTILKNNLKTLCDNVKVQSIMVGHPSPTLMVMNTGMNNVKDLSSLCANFSHLKEFTARNGSTQNATNMQQMFLNCNNLISMPELNMDNVTNAYQMFSGTGITEIKANILGSNIENASEMFSYCTRLVTLPSDYTTVFGRNSKLNNVGGLFMGCTNLLDVGIHNVFKYVEDETGVGDWVRDDSKLKNQLFTYCPNITNMSKILYNCSKVGSNAQNKGIPLGLFYNCTKVQDISLAFYGCKGLAVVTPGVLHCEVLFSKNLDLVNISGLFQQSKIEGVLTENPSNSGYILFPGTKIENASHLWDGCVMTGVQGDEYIPFVYNSKVLTDISYMFANQTCFRDLNNMFEGEYSWNNISTYCPALTNCAYLFSKDTELVGNGNTLITALNKITTLTNHTKAFEGCTKLTDYNTIPSGWK